LRRRPHSIIASGDIERGDSVVPEEQPHVSIRAAVVAVSLVPLDVLLDHAVPELVPLPDRGLYLGSPSTSIASFSEEPTCSLPWKR
jgi:hypothetical protein